MNTDEHTKRAEARRHVGTKYKAATGGRGRNER